MIIRRKRTENFTVINNAIFADDHLSPESLGVLTYLLSKPADWSVSLSQLRCRFNIGREKIQKVIRNLIATGYIESYRTRNPETNEYNGIEYIVYDQSQKPQPENPVVDGPQPE
jgi:DNA-binding MarR family transcriptional regulator